ncbi:hypothetical protein MRB53_038727 [Persea americana]|nr:hypothetical protein MRB53_038727 [Persea americana]
MFVMTSGLGVALSITSRRSLQYCLSLLSQAIEHVATVMKALRMVLEQYDQARDSWRKQHSDLQKSVSTTTGGALPENARHFVRTQLMSLPQRWKIVSEQKNGEGETSQTAHRMIAFATEGLDMMNQVSQVVRATLDSAERWLERVGRRDVPPSLQEKDTEMTDAAP